MGVSEPTLSPASTSPLKRMKLQPEWRPDAASSSCLCCSQQFSLFCRRHHCRVCGELVCASCSPYTELLPEYGYDSAVRVCTDCTSNGTVTTDTASAATTASDISNSDSDMDDDIELMDAALEAIELYSSQKQARLSYKDFVQSEAVSWLVDAGVVSNRKMATALFTRLIDDDFVTMKPWVGSSRTKFYVLCDDISTMGARTSHQYGRAMHSETNKCSNCSQCFLESLTTAPGFCSIDCKTNSLISQADSARVRRML